MTTSTPSPSGEPRFTDFAGRNVERVNALSDGIFAVVMTLLVLDLRLPAGNPASDNQQLWRDISELAPQLAAYGLSFALLGIFWLAHHTLLGLYERSDPTTVWIHLTFLFMVTVVPFSASVLAEHTELRLAVAIYWLNIVLMAIPIACSIAHARLAGLLADNAVGRLQTLRRRLYLAQVAYGASALLCLVDTRLSIAAIALTQLTFIVAPTGLHLRRALNGNRERFRGKRPNGPPEAS